VRVSKSLMRVLYSESLYLCEDPGVLLRGFVPLTIKVPNINQDYVIISYILHNISILENPKRFVFVL
jgi:hypothetical protein